MRTSAFEEDKMVKLAHLLVLLCLIIWLSASGCIGNDTSKVKEAGNSSNNTVARNSGTLNGDLEVGLTQSDLKELDSDMSDLQSLLENSSVGEDITVENMETVKSENRTK
jgi:hypothetical protein